LSKHWLKTNDTLGTDPKELRAGTHTDICTPLFIEVLVIVDKRRKQPKSLSTDEWLNKIWYTYTMEYYSAIKRNEVLTQAMPWMNLEDIVLHEISQTRKDIV
jgi:hypothetical protein